MAQDHCYLDRQGRARQFSRERRKQPCSPTGVRFVRQRDGEQLPGRNADRTDEEGLYPQKRLGHKQGRVSDLPAKVQPPPFYPAKETLKTSGDVNRDAFRGSAGIASSFIVRRPAKSRGRLFQIIDLDQTDAGADEFAVYDGRVLAGRQRQEESGLPRV